MESHSKTCATAARNKPQGLIYEVFFDKSSGLIGPGLRTGKKLFDCSEHDRIVVFWKNGLCAALSPKRKQSLEKGIVKIFKSDTRRSHEKHYFCACTEPLYGFSYLIVYSSSAFAKLGHRYTYSPHKGKVLFVEDSPPTIYIKYVQDEKYKIKQKVCRVLPIDMMGTIRFEISNGRFAERLEKKYSFAQDRPDYFGNTILAARPIESLSLSVPDWLDPNEVVQCPSTEASNLTEGRGSCGVVRGPSNEAPKSGTTGSDMIATVNCHSSGS